MSTTATGPAAGPEPAAAAHHSEVRPPPRLGYVGEFVDQTIRPLQNGYRRDHGEAVAKLARLRRGAGKPAGTVSDLWGLTADESLYGRRRGPDGERAEPTPDAADAAEVAAHVALTLYALHQQSHREQQMHFRGAELGASVRRLMQPGEIDEAIRRRFVQVGNAQTAEVLAQRLRELVLLMRRNAIPLDYGLLADQLELAQHPQGRERVRRAWGRSFHAYRPPREGGKAADGGTGTGIDTGTEPGSDPATTTDPATDPATRTQSRTHPKDDEA